jgi:hypothetical protein
VIVIAPGVLLVTAIVPVAPELSVVASTAVPDTEDAVPCVAVAVVGPVAYPVPPDWNVAVAARVVLPVRASHHTEPSENVRIMCCPVVPETVKPDV